MRTSHVMTILTLIVLLGLTGCVQQMQAPAPPPDQAVPTLPEPTSGPPPTPTPEPPGYYIQPGVPAALAGPAAAAFEAAGMARHDTRENAAAWLAAGNQPDARLAAQWVYALVAPFATIPDDISWGAFVAYWQAGDSSTLPDFGSAPTLVMAQDAADLLASLLGMPSASTPLQIVAEDLVTDTLWAARPSLGVVPFEMLNPRLKVIILDGLSVLDRDLDPMAYPLTIPFAAGGQGEAAEAGLGTLGAGWPASNRDPARISVVTLTGVTAMARATAMQMELRGYDFPLRQIAPFFADADILHTSNEVAFATDCPNPDWVGEPIFCSKRAYFALLEAMGLDIVELTGNHVNDWGTAALAYTLDVYDGAGLPYYGGGRTLDDARQPRILTTPDGTRVAFLGCNSAGPFSAYASVEAPGAAPCDEWADIRARIADLKASGQADLVIATLQYFELPSYAPSAEQIADFEALAAAGADIISGSQAHQPQGFSFADGAFIHYGVGNLFFDQMDYIENRQMFADKHILYAGRHIATVLFTGLMEDYAQPRPMTAEERAGFLELIFEASGW